MKLVYYLYDDALGHNVIFSDVDHLLSYMRSYLVDLADDDEITFCCGTESLTQEEIDRIPVT